MSGCKIRFSTFLHNELEDMQTIGFYNITNGSLIDVEIESEIE